MDAAPILAKLAELLNRHKLEAIMVGNAAAALQGVPITTVDIDFLFRRTPANVRKLKDVAEDLNAVVFRPFYPIVPLFRLSRETDHLQIDFMSEISGVRSYEGLRSRATLVKFGDASLHVASLPDIIRSKKAAGRPQDLAALPILEESLEELSRVKKSETGSASKGE